MRFMLNDKESLIKRLEFKLKREKDERAADLKEGMSSTMN